MSFGTSRRISGAYRGSNHAGFLLLYAMLRESSVVRWSHADAQRQRSDCSVPRRSAVSRRPDHRRSKRDCSTTVDTDR
jgi:hypothetical protein